MPLRSREKALGPHLMVSGLQSMALRLPHPLPTSTTTAPPWDSPPLGDGLGDVFEHQWNRKEAKGIAQPPTPVLSLVDHRGETGYSPRCARNQGNQLSPSRGCTGSQDQRGHEKGAHYLLGGWIWVCLISGCTPSPAYLAECWVSGWKSRRFPPIPVLPGPAWVTCPPPAPVSALGTPLHLSATSGGSSLGQPQELTESGP